MLSLFAVLEGEQVDVLSNPFKATIRKKSGCIQDISTTHSILAYTSLLGSVAARCADNQDNDGRDGSFPIATVTSISTK